MKFLVNKLALCIVCLALGGGGAAGAAKVMGVGPFASAAVASEGKTAEPAPVAVMFPTRERIVNLADTGTMRYLKTTIVLEMIDRQVKGELPKGDEYKKLQDDLAKELRSQLAVIDDQITVTLSTKTSGDLVTADGKQRLKEEVKARLNKALGEERVLGVYFTDFIVQ